MKQNKHKNKIEINGDNNDIDLSSEKKVSWKKLSLSAGFTLGSLTLGLGSMYGIQDTMHKKEVKRMEEELEKEMKRMEEKIKNIVESHKKEMTILKEIVNNKDLTILNKITILSVLFSIKQIEKNKLKTYTDNVLENIDDFKTIAYISREDAKLIKAINKLIEIAKSTGDTEWEKYLRNKIAIIKKR